MSDRYMATQIMAEAIFNRGGNYKRWADADEATRRAYLAAAEAAYDSLRIEHQRVWNEYDAEGIAQLKETGTLPTPIDRYPLYRMRALEAEHE